jgi:glycolate oxidase
VTTDALAELELDLPTGRVASGDVVNPDDLHDESLHPTVQTPLAVVYPQNTEEVARTLAWATRHGIPVVPRGSGTGMSGGATPVATGIVLSLARMNTVLDINTRDHVAVVQPGVTLRDLEAALEGTGLYYPVYPGELSGSLGGNVNTNAGGMRAVRHGVTRAHILGLEAVQIDGTVFRTGGPVVKSSSGYDLTQLLIGSEGTLAVVTEITLRLSPRMPERTTVLVPFATLHEITEVVPTIVASGLQPSILEYIDILTMTGVTSRAGLDLGVAEDVAAKAMAYLVVVLETRTRAQLDGDIEALATLVDDAGALDVYVLEGSAGPKLIEAREGAFWVAKEAGAHDIIDVVVPRASVPGFLADVADMAQRHESFIAGCGHVGDGNVHLSVFQPDVERRTALLDELFAAGVALGGAVSGEHGIGRDKQRPFLMLSNPENLALQRAIKHVFDPQQLLNPHRLLDERPLP